MSDAIGAAWSDVRNDKSDTHWVVCKANDDLKGLSLTASGTSGFDDFMKAFEGAETVMYGGMRIRAVDNRGTVKSVRSKFIKVALIPDNIPAVKRARATQLKPIADELLGGTHASFDIATSADLTRKVVEKQLQATCGAHQPSHYDFDGINGEDAHTNANKGIAVAAPPPAPEEPKSPEKPPEPSPKREAPAAPAVEVPASIADAWALVQGNSSPINWVALTYDGKSAASAKMLGMGDDGLAGFKEILEDDLVIFGGLRVTAIDDRGTVKSIRAKYVFVQFVGTGVKPLTRANAGPMKSHFEAILSGCHLTVATSNVADLTAEMIEQRLQSNCGAHRPNGYDFGKKIVDMASF